MQNNIKRETLSIHRGRYNNGNETCENNTTFNRKPNMVLTSVGYFINGEMLKECHLKMDEDKAVGNDGITKEEYGRNLDVKFELLIR